MSCWEEDPSLRPYFSQLKLQFKKLIEEKLEVIAFPSAEDEFEANHSPIIGLGISEDGSTVASRRERSASLSEKDLLESERLTRPVSAPSLNREEGECLDLEPPNIIKVLILMFERRSTIPSLKFRRISMVGIVKKCLKFLYRQVKKLECYAFLRMYFFNPQ